MQGMALLLIFIAVMACVFLSLKNYKNMQLLRDEVVALRMIPRGHVEISNDNTMPSGMPVSDNQQAGNLDPKDMELIMQMIKQNQGV